MNTPTSQQIAKLPKWAQKYISKIERQRDNSVRALNEFADKQTESPVFYEDMICTGESSGPSLKRCYIQTSRIEMHHEGVELSVFLRVGEGIEIGWSSKNRLGSEVAMIPRGFQQVRLVAKENMR